MFGVLLGNIVLNVVVRYKTKLWPIFIWKNIRYYDDRLESRYRGC